MKSVQEVFSHLLEIKREQKEYATAYKNALDNTDNYTEITEQLKKLREKKKQIETAVKNQLGKAYEKLEELKADMQSEKEMLSDVAITTLMGGETVEVRDEYENLYEPVWSVKFKKTNIEAVKKPPEASSEKAPVPAIKAE